MQTDRPEIYRIAERLLNATNHEDLFEPENDGHADALRGLCDAQLEMRAALHAVQQPKAPSGAPAHPE
jgi:hypothetical protein